ncbi:MAG: SIMPL domain-containing protein [Sandaracinaceae bacterium]
MKDDHAADYAAERAAEPTTTRRQRAWSRASVAIAAVAVTLIGALALTHYVDVRYGTDRTVRVSGSASQRITSDRAIWSARVIARGPSVAEAYAVLHRDVPRVVQFLVDQGLSADDISTQSVHTSELHAHNEDGLELEEEIVGYELTQAVQVTSTEVALVGRSARDVTQLIEQGIYIVSSAPEYIYSELGEVKIRLVGDATADARARAEQVAENSGSALGALESANVGVVQVNAANETQVSWEGVYDRSSVDKDVMVVVSTTFALE